MKNGVKITVKEGFLWLESDFDFPRAKIQSPSGIEYVYERHKDAINRFLNVSKIVYILGYSGYDISFTFSSLKSAGPRECAYMLM